MRVLHIVECFGGGTMEIVLALSRRLADEGNDVAIAYGRRPETPADVRAFVDERIEVFETPWTSRTLAAQFRSVAYLRRLVADWRPDVVHLHSSFAGVGGSLAARKVPIVYTPHGYSFAQRHVSRVNRAVFVAIERFVARRITLLGAVSEQEAELARSVAKARRAVVAYNGVPELDDPPGPTAKSGERPRVIALGRIVPQRQPAATAQILAAVSDIADVAWVGDVNDPERSAIVRDAGVEVTGWVTRERALDELGAAEVYLHWSAWDGHPLTVLEALARDAVVIASDIAPNREILGAGQVFGTEMDAIAAIRAVLEDPARRAAYLESQHERRGAFSARRMTTQWLEIYAELAASASISRP